MLNKCQLIINLSLSLLLAIFFFFFGYSRTYVIPRVSPAQDERRILLLFCLSREWKNELSLKDESARNIDLMLDFRSQLYVCARYQALQFQYVKGFQW